MIIFAIMNKESSYIAPELCVCFMAGSRVVCGSDSELGGYDDGTGDGQGWSTDPND